MKKATFNKNWNKLLAFCELINIKLFIGEVEQIDFEKKSITIMLNQDYENIIAGALHEIGHYMDYIHNAKLYKKKRLANAIRLSNLKLQRAEKAQLLRMELRAWNYAATTAKLLKIRLPNLSLIRKQNITTYAILKTVKRPRKI